MLGGSYKGGLAAINIGPRYDPKTLAGQIRILFVGDGGKIHHLNTLDGKWYIGFTGFTAVPGSDIAINAIRDPKTGQVTDISVIYVDPKEGLKEFVCDEKNNRNQYFPGESPFLPFLLFLLPPPLPLPPRFPLSSASSPRSSPLSPLTNSSSPPSPSHRPQIPHHLPTPLRLRIWRPTPLIPHLHPQCPRRRRTVGHADRLVHRRMVADRLQRRLRPRLRGRQCSCDCVGRGSAGVLQSEDVWDKDCRGWGE